MTTRAKAGICKSNPKHVLLIHKTFYPEPKTVTTALKHPGWNGAMTEEIDNCNETHLVLGSVYSGYECFRQQMGLQDKTQC